MQNRRLPYFLALAFIPSLLALQGCAHGNRVDEAERGSGSSADVARSEGPASANTVEVRRISRETGETLGRTTRSLATNRRVDDAELAEMTTSELESRARKRELGETSYRWHAQPREVRGRIDCPDVEIVEYDGEIIDYNQPIEINPEFRRRLVRFERIVRDTALAVYGRAPDEIVHHGGHVCRTIGGDGDKMSEHSFGHAIDVSGFRFEALPASRDRELRHRRADEAFEVRLEDHWNASFGFKRRHRMFLRRLARQLTYRGPFSGMLGPSYPGHDEMFHFDFGPEFFFRL